MSVTFVHISDTHISTNAAYTGKYGRYPANLGAYALVKHINELPFDVDFILHTGDVIYDPDESAYAIAADIFSRLRFPIFYVAGNHDHAVGLQTSLLNRAESELQYPLHYEYDIKGVQIVGIDSNGPATLPAGYVIPHQLDFLNRICSANDPRPLIVGIHHNVVKVGFDWLDNYMGTKNGDDVHAVLLQARHRLRGVFTGHIHQNLDVVQDGILYSSALSSWFQFIAYEGMEKTTIDDVSLPGFSVVKLAKDQTLIRRYYFPRPE